MEKQLMDKDEYIKSLEMQIESLLEPKGDLQTILGMQEDFLTQKYAEKDFLLSENQRLNDEIGRLTRTVLLDYNYIDYLLNSFWWKITFPFRLISRKLRNVFHKNNSSFQFVSDINPDNELACLNTSVSVIIFTYNAGADFTFQLENLRSQKQVKDIEIIVFDRGSTDDTVKLAKKYGATVIDVKGFNLTDAEIYERSLSKITGQYVVLMEQNKVVNSNYWIYQSINPILENQAKIVAFFMTGARKDINAIKSSSYYQELKNRICDIADEKVIFLPENRDIIQYISPIILDKSVILIKKKISNIMYI